MHLLRVWRGPEQVVFGDRISCWKVEIDRLLSWRAEARFCGKAVQLFCGLRLVVKAVQIQLATMHLLLGLACRLWEFLVLKRTGEDDLKQSAEILMKRSTSYV